MYINVCTYLYINIYIERDILDAPHDGGLASGVGSREHHDAVEKQPVRYRAPPTPPRVHPEGDHPLHLHGAATPGGSERRQSPPCARKNGLR